MKRNLRPSLRCLLLIAAIALAAGGCKKGKQNGRSKAGSTAGSAGGGGGSSGGSGGGGTAAKANTLDQAKAETQAKRFVAHMTGGRFGEAAKMMTPRMLQAMPAERLGATWRGVSSQLGAFKRVVKVEGKAIGTSFTFQLTALFENQPFNVVVSIDAAGRVQGLFFKPAMLPRPQHPKPPYPYAAREVVFVNKTDKTKHAGTLTHPKGNGPFPAAVLVTGSGSQDRDETILQHKPFLVIADHLTRAGFAVLRIDDRGVGGSGGDPNTATIQIHATDAGAAIDFLKKQKVVNSKAIGLIGHSEGGAIAPIVAARRADVAFVISLAGSALPGDKIVAEQVLAIARAQPGMDKAKLDKLLAAQNEVLAAAKSGSRDKLRQVVKKATAVGKQIGLKGAGQINAAMIDAQVKQLLSPWYQSFLKTDPAVHWAKVKKARVLALNGAKDTQVLADKNLPRIEAALKKAKNPDVTIKSLPGLNHLFQPCKTGLLNEYALIPITFDKGALQLIADWLAKRFPPPKG
ncbi:MAG: alpha/beta fold hydrolase [Myxococcales bacterium]|nr:alpha/beta fold hydrolase [Myxococcales bacterium]